MGLVILNAADGKELARHPWKTELDVNAATPIYADKKVFISSGYDVGCALLDITRDKPQVVWQTKVMRNHFTTCILINGFLYGFDESELKCVDFKTGQERWKQGGLGKGSLSAAGDKLIIISESGEVVTAEASPEGYKQASRARVLSATCWTMPVLAGGKIYVRNNAGDMAVVDVGAKAD
jgi:outer membrane protein assembly factor BamB